MTDAVTVVLTSCGRFDLLERGLRSFYKKNTAPIDRFLFMENSGDETAREIARSVDPGIEVHLGRRGQLGSIDHAYGLVETPFIFHCEDDYVYFRGNFIEESMTILKADNQISMVSGRTWHHDNLFHVPVTEHSGISVRLPRRSLHPGWFGYAFHTGLRRKREWERFGPFAQHSREWDVSYTMKRAGFRMAYLAEEAYVDDDNGVSIGAKDPMRARFGWRRKLYRLRKMLKKRLFKIERALGYYTD